MGGIEGNEVGPSYDVKRVLYSPPTAFLNNVNNPDSDQDPVGSVSLLSNPDTYRI